MLTEQLLIELIELFRAEAWYAASHVVTAVKDWLRHGRPGGTLIAYADEPTVKPSTDLLSEIARLRKAVEERKAQIERIQSAHFPAS